MGAKTLTFLGSALVKGTYGWLHAPFLKTRSSRTFRRGVKLGHASGIRFHNSGVAVCEQVYAPSSCLLLYICSP